jgi:hypothetical protein
MKTVAIHASALTHQSLVNALVARMRARFTSQRAAPRSFHAMTFDDADLFLAA